jgi:hypothetical protein
LRTYHKALYPSKENLTCHLDYLITKVFAANIMFTSRFSTVAARVSKVAFSTAAKQRPFKILGVQQIAIGCAERGPLNALWKDIFGLEPYASKRMEGENVDEDILRVGPIPFEVEVDLMTPIDPEGSPKVR